MLHAILITSRDQNQAFQLAQKLSQNQLTPQPDLLILTAAAGIGIDQVKTLRNFLSRKPYQSPFKIVLIPQADTLTLAAQQALLKTLEEPPAHSLIILIASHQRTLLPTIISRCELHDIPASGELTRQFIHEQQTIYNSLAQANLGQKIKLVSQYSNSKTSAVDFCRQQLQLLRQKQLIKPNQQLSIVLKQLNLAVNRLQANLNPKLCLEELIFHYPNPSPADKIDSG